jgi:hypothetical protein
VTNGVAAAKGVAIKEDIAAHSAISRIAMVMSIRGSFREISKLTAMVPPP